jgi:pimeloyl-ACP methyl ester carboxylesterase
MSEPPLFYGPVETPTLILYGADDHVVGPDFMHFCERAFTNRIGPLVIPGAGHFLQWERADVFNPLVAAVFDGLRR